MSFNDDNPLVNLPVELACLVEWAVNSFVFMPAALSVLRVLHIYLLFVFPRDHVYSSSVVRFLIFWIFLKLWCIQQCSLLGILFHQLEMLVKLLVLDGTWLLCILWLLVCKKWLGKCLCPCALLTMSLMFDIYG